jgi:hypothetical protein
MHVAASLLINETGNIGTMAGCVSYPVRSIFYRVPTS